MPRTRITTDILYSYDELSDEAKENAISIIVSDTIETFDCDQLTEQFKEKLQEWGFPTDRIEWSLSYSQGDGVAFYGSIDLVKYARHRKILSKFRNLLHSPNVHSEATIMRNSFGNHYSHYNTMDVLAVIETVNTWELTTRQGILSKELEDMLREDVRTVSRELEKLGYAEIEYQQSREVIEGLIGLNDWEFYEDGRMA